MATLKQRKAVEQIVENHGNVSRAMLDVGYEPNTAKNPKNLTDSKGFQEICEEIGLTDSFIIKALHDDIRRKPGKRTAELSLAAKIRGLEKVAPNNVNFLIGITPANSERSESFTKWLEQQ